MACIAVYCSRELFPIPVTYSMSILSMHKLTVNYHSLSRAEVLGLIVNTLW